MKTETTNNAVFTSKITVQAYPCETTMVIFGAWASEEITEILTTLGYPDVRSEAGRSLRWGYSETEAGRPTVYFGQSGIGRHERREEARILAALNAR